MSRSSADMLQELWDKSQIERLMTNLGRAIDVGDWALYRRCLADQIDVNFERSTGFPEIRVDADTWIRLVELLLSPVRRHHQFSNYAIDLSGDKADAVVYLVARHWRSTDGGASEFIQNGWYENKFARIDGDWKITRLLHTHQWLSGNSGLFGTPSPQAAQLMNRVFAEENRVTK